MKFSELLNVDNIDIKKAYVLGLIYAWPILNNDKTIILAYSAYRLGDRSEKSLSMSINEYFNLHIKKLEQFLGSDYIIGLNSSIKDKSMFTERIQNGVSVLIEFDFKTTLDIEFFIYGLIEKWLIDIEDIYKNYFLIGVMDGRGSLDFTGKFLSIDIAKKDNPELVKRKINKFNDIIGAVFNYNPRLAQEKSFKKNDQFRLPLNYYMGNFGLFIPFKIDYYKSERGINVDYFKNEFFFIDKNYENLELDSKFISAKNLEINELAIKLKKQDLSNAEKIKILEEYKSKNMSSDTDDEILYSSQNVKEMAKRQFGYKCEANPEHISFTAKTVNNNYVEAHHLIPFCERNRFDLSIDILENIVCLCPNCHRKIHLAIDEEKIQLIKPLFERKKGTLQKAGIFLSEDQLLEFYKVHN